MTELFYKGNKAYLKGKYGMFYDVTIRKIEGSYAFIKGDNFMIGNQKVRLDNLYKEPTETFKRESNNIEKEIRKAERELFKFKNINSI